MLKTGSLTTGRSGQATIGPLKDKDKGKWIPCQGRNDVGNIEYRIKNIE